MSSEASFKGEIWDGLYILAKNYCLKYHCRTVVKAMNKHWFSVGQLVGDTPLHPMTAVLFMAAADPQAAREKKRWEQFLF